MVDYSKYLDWIKLSPRYLLPIALFTGFALFAPSRWLEAFGLVDWIGRYRAFFGLAFLASTVLLLSSGIMVIYDWWKGWREEAQQLKQLREGLHTLSEPEKRFFAGICTTGPRPSTSPCRTVWWAAC